MAQIWQKLIFLNNTGKNMKLFDLNPYEERNLKKVVLWHLGYVLIIAAFFAFIYYFGLYKSHQLLKESPLFTYMAPLFTAIFVIISPWRGQWRRAIIDTYDRLDHEPVFCFMGAFVFLVGFFLYSVLLWGLGALGPALFYM
ncbi:hypothetical protein C4J81_10595 [Deltaproteobacteria bacterium Smac51]|nr:hypothetical protein C4J81_10595 [Deltaproteobacteria bacterium Smac51]